MSCVLFPRLLGPIPLDVVITEEHYSSLAITENPIEFGADVADHAYVEPKRLRMHCAIAGGPIGGGIIHGFPSTRVQAAYEALVALQESREPFDIVTGLTIYENMLIESIIPFRDVRNAAILEFDVSLKEVIVVESAYTEGVQDGAEGKRGKSDRPGKQGGPQPEPGETAQRAAGDINRGQQTPSPQSTSPSTVEGARNSSILFDMLGLEPSFPSADPSLPPI